MISEKEAREILNEKYAAIDYGEAWKRLEYLLSPNRTNPCTEDDLHAALTEGVCVDWLLEKYDPICYRIAIDYIIKKY